MSAQGRTTEATAPLEIETMEGRYFNLADPKPEEVDLVDISTALANESRFNGFITRPCSIAEHAMLVATILHGWGRQDLVLAGLHHDSHEAYTGDITTPMKRLIGIDRLGPIVQNIDCAIATAFGIDVRLFSHPVVKDADVLALRLEAREVKHSQGAGEHWGWAVPVDPIDFGWFPGAEPCNPEDAAWHFRELHGDLTRGRP